MSGSDAPAGGAVRAVGVSSGVFAIALGVLVLTGWAVGSRVLKSVAPGLPSMKANTALALMCAGAAVLSLSQGSGGASRRIGRVLAVVVAGLGVVVIAEYLFGGFGIDQLLFRDTLGSYPGRPSPHTALALLALGSALATVGLDGRWRRTHFVMLAVTATVVLFAAVGYLYGVDYLRGTSGTSGMAVHTLVALVLLVVAVPCLEPDAGLAGWLRSDDSGAQMTRVLIPVAVGGPLVLGAVRFATEQLGWIGWRIGLSTYTLAMIFVLALVVTVVARRLRTSDLELRRLAAIVDASDDAMINKTIEGVILSWNRAAERMYGYPSAEVLGRSISFLAPPDRRDEIGQLLGRVKSGQVQRVETERVRRDGTRLSVALTISPICDQTGRVIGASTTARDITQRKEAERRLDDASRRLIEAQSIAGLGSWELDVQDGHAAWSDQLYEIFGADRDTIASGDSSAFRELLHPDDRQKYLETLAGVQETGTAAEVVFRIRRPDGEERILETRAELAHQNGRAKLVGTVMDITETRRLQQQLTAARDLFAGVLDAATETSIIATDQNGVITVFNRGAERMLGRRAADMIGIHRLTLLHSPSEIAARAAELGVEPGFEVLTHGVHGEGSETREWSYVHADGHRLAVSLTMTAVRVGGREIQGFIGVARDVTEVRAAEVARRRAEQRFETAFEHAPFGVAITGIRGADRDHFLHANQALARLVGLEPGALDGTAIATLAHPDDLDSTEDALARLDRMETVERETRYRHRDGRWIAVLVSSTPIMDESDGRPLYCVSQVLDISERNRFEAQLRHLADHDALTGLYNRRRFESELHRVTDESRRYSRRFALLILDLDGFKNINDRFGHAAGDELVSRIGRLLRQTVRDTDIIARLGGDEFVIILHEADQQDAITVADKVLDAIRLGGVVRDGHQLARVTSSIGITTSDGASELRDEELVAEADTAMYDAKSDGSDRYSVYDRDRRHLPASGHSWLERLRHAIDEDLFVLHAQPIVGICANGMPGYELLLRMRDDDGDLIPPGAFLYNAERFDLIGGIDRWVLQKAIMMMHDNTAAPRPLSLTVNVSGKTMNDPTLSDDLATMLAEHPIPHGQLVIEITEAAALLNIGRARDLADELHNLGCRLSLDDFGSGFASFYYLKHLNFDYLKIDGEFIAKLIDSTTDQLVVRALVDIARELQTRTVAKCVGDDTTLELLRTLGVDYGQGYHLGRPAPVSELFAGPGSPVTRTGLQARYPSPQRQETLKVDTRRPKHPASRIDRGEALPS